MANYKQMAMEQLSFTVADLRNPEKVALIKQTAASLKEADRVKRTGDRLTQRQVALALNTFPGFAEDPDQIGPTIQEIHSFFVEDGINGGGELNNEELIKLLINKGNDVKKYHTHGLAIQNLPDKETKLIVANFVASCVCSAWSVSYCIRSCGDGVGLTPVTLCACFIC